MFYVLMLHVVGGRTRTKEYYKKMPAAQCPNKWKTEDDEDTTRQRSSLVLEAS